MTDDMKDALVRARGAQSASPSAGEGLDVVSLWPELFEQLNELQRNSIRQACAANWHEGWTPNRGDVANLAAHTQGDLDDEEYLRRARTRAADPESDG